MSNRDTDELLDHDYDGIREYDNPLPRWWLYLFYGTVAWSLFYVPWAHLDGHLPGDEYAAEVAEATAKQPQRSSGVGIDLASADGNPDRISRGKETFGKLCVACHGPEAGGLVGPNLTDAHWIHGGSLASIVQTVTEGVPAKGMISWKTQLAPDEIVSVAAYIRSLKGTHPANPKAPEGQPE